MTSPIHPTIAASLAPILPQHRTTPVRQQKRTITYEDAAHLDNLLQKWEFALMEAAEAQARFRSEFQRIVIPLPERRRV